MKFANLFLAGVLVLIVGCGSAPKRDDYARHIKLDSSAMSFNEAPTFKVDLESTIDVRGEYSSDNSVAGGGQMYHGGAGLAGFVAQIAAHSAITESIKADKIAQQQKQANEILGPISDIIRTTKYAELVSTNELGYKVIAEKTAQGPLVNVKTIFFVSPEFEYLSAKNILWIDKNKQSRKSKKSKKKKKADDLLYQNVVEVFSKKFTDNDKEKLKSDPEFLKMQLKEILEQSLSVATKELTGKYQGIKKPSKSYKLAKKKSSRYIRASEVDKLCNKVVLRNLRNWLIVVPQNVSGQSSEEVSPELACHSAGINPEVSTSK